jgi:hypothetical protein
VIHRFGDSEFPRQLPWPVLGVSSMASKADEADKGVVVAARLQAYKRINIALLKGVKDLIATEKGMCMCNHDDGCCVRRAETGGRSTSASMTNAALYPCGGSCAERSEDFCR